MCTGTTTHMSCGHTLIHYTSYCGHSTSRTPPKPCTTLSSGPHYTLNDTCAQCHPPALIQRITKQHDMLRVMLMDKMRTASSREQVLAWQKKLEDEQRELRRELREANALSWDGVVEWPGRRDEGRRVGGGERDEGRQVRTSSAVTKSGEERKERSREERLVNGTKKGKRYKIEGVGVDAA